ncbi:hypothetical protein TRFO_41479 [Tritrichomonas foetus]|uniref:RING-type E3 ubiquitin transferase n=1 Tax=Tritrichomonas foetus TaxID=1144522 RepID=A0A1J4L0F5_9EUKA|nr:hypothetical protein TRFO_41479 [Tritrichomonas foetus]|eukprot:OHT16882.1 hypothetical protein TRFO_41479 [Tritrichomonas foetus]
MKRCHCYQCDRTVMISGNNLICPECGSDFLEVVEENINSNNTNNNFQNQFLGSIFNQLNSNLGNINLNANHSGDQFSDVFQDVASHLFRDLFHRRSGEEILENLITTLSGRLERRFGTDFIHSIAENLRNLSRLHQGRPPASEDVINSLHPQQYSEGVCLDSTCAICLTEMENGDEVIVLNCRHGYHKDCIEPWLRTHNVCPTCREVQT